MCIRVCEGARTLCALSLSRRVDNQDMIGYTVPRGVRGWWIIPSLFRAGTVRRAWPQSALVPARLSLRISGHPHQGSQPLTWVLILPGQYPTRSTSRDHIHKHMLSIKWIPEGEWAISLGVPVGNDLDTKRWWNKKLEGTRNHFKRWIALFQPWFQHSYTSPVNTTVWGSLTLLLLM